MDVKYRVFGSWEKFLYLDDSLTDKEIARRCMHDYATCEPEKICNDTVEMTITKKGIPFKVTAKVSLNPTVRAVEIMGDDQ